MSSHNENTLLNVFLNLSEHPDSSALSILECASEHWTYRNLNIVSSGLAVELKEKFGTRPIVAVVTENHPYVFALLFAVWKLGGIVAPIDSHAPGTLLEHMLISITPTCVVTSTMDSTVLDIVNELKFSSVAFSPEESTIASLDQRFLFTPPEVSQFSLLPSEEDIALYIYTSSASSISNLKCVPLSHKSILTGCRGRLAWWRKAWPEKTFRHLRALGWSPWSHVIGISHDIGAATLLTAGCYVFALTPSTYHIEVRGIHDLDHYATIAGYLFESAIRKRPTAFDGVPWVLESFMSIWKQEGSLTRKEILTDALRGFHIIGAGGAKISPECLQWANDLSLPLYVDIGMTEAGGPLFHMLPGNTTGYPIGECFLPDADIRLSADNQSAEGELIVTSNYISQGYLKQDSLIFEPHADGRVTLYTGDIYERVQENCLLWKGRKEDLIQMITGESLDPRTVEQALDECSAIHRSCVVGNNFLRGPAEVVCAIIEPAVETKENFLADITRAIASINRILAPPLRIAWSRVLILPQEQHIPLTRKGTLFRKKLEEQFGTQLSSLLNDNGRERNVANASSSIVETSTTGATRDNVELVVSRVVSEALRISPGVLASNSQCTFAELGLDSAMAVAIVNALNLRLGLSLAINTCHIYVDFISLVEAVCMEIGISARNSRADVKQDCAMVPAIDDVVIVGQAIRLPGDINTPRSFWQALVERRSDIMTTVPADRWDHESFYRHPDSSEPPQPCDITFEKAGFIDIAHFDNSFFGISSAEALHICPAVRLTLETAFEALENGNIPISSVKGTNMGVFVAAGVDEGYNKLLFLEKGFAAYSRFYGTGVAISTTCGRLSYLLDVHGPSITVDTACSSGLVILDEAVRYLQSGQGESAIVSGVNTHSWPGTFGFLSAQKMTSINSRCATFTNEADGYGASEGAIALVLKSHKAAIRDGNQILAVIKATDVEHDGRSQGLVAPNIKAQINMQRTLLAKAGLTPSNIDFIETHGTGTTLGDLIEIQAINEVFQESHGAKKPLILAASKTCLGHAELAAGLVGVLAAIGSISNGLAPGLVHLTDDNMNPSIDCSKVPLKIPVEAIPLPPVEGKPLRGLVLANGFAGTIAGTILEAPPTDIRSAPATADVGSRPSIFVVSAKTQDALNEYVAKYLQFCKRASPTKFQSICYTSCLRRDHYKHRFACAVINMEDLIHRLESYLPSDRRFVAGNCGVIFGFPGQGSQYAGMARDLADQYSEFKSIISKSAKAASSVTGYDVLRLLLEPASDGNRTIDRSDIAQVCIFVYQYSICCWLQALGIQPQGVLGHSIGEIAAAVIAGGLTFDNALKLVAMRANILRADAHHPGGMAAVGAEEDVVMEYIDKLKLNGRVVIGVHNGPKSFVISGDLSCVDLLVSTAKSDGFRAAKLSVDQGFHSPSIAPALPQLKASLKEIEYFFTPLRIPLFSTMLGKQVPKGQVLTSQYWVLHAKNPVKFYQAAIEVIDQNFADIVVDVGPQPTVWSNLQSSEFSHKITLAVTGKRGKNQELIFLETLARLFESGLMPNFSALFYQRGETCSWMELPTYPFQRQRHYPTYIASRRQDVLTVPQSITSKEKVHIFPINQALCDMLDEHRIEGRRVLPGAASVDFFARTNSLKSVQLIRFHQPLVVETPESRVHGELGEDGTFILFQDSSNGRKICSGQLARKVSYDQQEIAFSGPPVTILEHGEVYECFKNVAFGEAFRNIQNISIWPDHADGLILIKETDHPALDRIRKLDSCLHMFGAIASREVPRCDGGSYLPSSLEGFTLHGEYIPNTFICRYYLPLEVSRNSQVLSASFEVFTNDGKLLLSCKKYSVAWVPAGVVIQRKDSSMVSESRPTPWLHTVWNSSPLSCRNDDRRLERLLYIDITGDSRLWRSLSAGSNASLLLDLHSPENILLHSGDNTTVLESDFKGLEDYIQGGSVTVVVDVIRVLAIPGTDFFTLLCRRMLMFLKFMAKRKDQISAFVVVSSMSIGVAALVQDDVKASEEMQQPSVDVVVQGMLRVFRRETGLDSIIWGIDLPVPECSYNPDIGELLLREIHNREEGTVRDTMVAYRTRHSNAPLRRLTPVMRYMTGTIGEIRFAGVSVIIGMGSIGIALAMGFIAAGSNHIALIGRRALDDPSVQNELFQLKSVINDRCSYVQADICDRESIRAVFNNIQTHHGKIRDIVHTAAVISDAPISKVITANFESVLRPKVIGAWNLHTISEELGLELNSFAMLSSTQVLVGNPGQVAYVAGNSFMDALAAFRHSRGLPGASLQLGAWESKVLQLIDLSQGFVHVVHHQQGIPLLLQAISVPVPVQVIADWDVEKLMATPALAKDPFFSVVLPTSISQKEKIDKAGAKKAVIDILRSILELRSNEELDLDQSLTSLGIDSISFAQIRGQVLKVLEIDVPMVYLSDNFTAGDMVSSITDHFN